MKRLLFVVLLLLSFSSQAQISVVQGSDGGIADATSVAVAFSSNVTSGNRIFVIGEQFTATDNGTFVAGNCTATAGTATLGTIELLHVVGGASLGAGEGWMGTAIWTAEVTGSGSLTMTVARNVSGTSYVTGAQLVEASGNWESTLTATDTGGSIDSSSSTAATTGNMTGDGLFLGGVGVGGLPTATPDGNFTEISEDTNVSDQVLTSGIYRVFDGTDAAAWTLGGTLIGNGTVGVVVQEAASGNTSLRRRRSN